MEEARNKCYFSSVSFYFYFKQKLVSKSANSGEKFPKIESWRGNSGKSRERLNSIWPKLAQNKILNLENDFLLDKMCFRIQKPFGWKNLPKNSQKL